MGRYLLTAAFFLLPYLASADVVFDNLAAVGTTYGISLTEDDAHRGAIFLPTSEITFDTLRARIYATVDWTCSQQFTIWEGPTSTPTLVAVSDFQEVIGTPTNSELYTWHFPETITFSLSKIYIILLNGNDCSSWIGGNATGNGLRPVAYDENYQYENEYPSYNPPAPPVAMTNQFGLELSFSGYENGRIETWTPCAASSQNEETSVCGIETLPSSLRVTGVYDVEEAPWKLEVSLWDEDWELLDSIATAYENDIYGNFDFAFVAPSASSSYRITACAVPIDGTSYFGAGTCARSLIGIGYATTTYETYLEQAGLSVGQSSTDIWSSLGCSDVGITDVAKGMKCALIWAFRPSDTALNGLESLRDRVLHTWPLGYATLAYEEFASTTSATSSTVLDVDVDLKRFFGQSGATTTIDFGNITSGIEDFRPVLEPLEWILWGLWGLGIISWGLRVRL